MYFGIREANGKLSIYSIVYINLIYKIAIYTMPHYTPDCIMTYNMTRYDSCCRYDLISMADTLGVPYTAISRSFYRLKTKSRLTCSAQGHHQAEGFVGLGVYSEGPVEMDLKFFKFRYSCRIITIWNYRMFWHVILRLTDRYMAWRYLRPTLCVCRSRSFSSFPRPFYIHFRRAHNTILEKRAGLTYYLQGTVWKWEVHYRAVRPHNIVVLQYNIIICNECIMFPQVMTYYYTHNIMYAHIPRYNIIIILYRSRGPWVIK